MAPSVIAHTHVIGVANVSILRGHQLGTVKFGPEDDAVNLGSLNK